MLINWHCWHTILYFLQNHYCQIIAVIKQTTQNCLPTRANILTRRSLCVSRIWRYSSHQRFAYVINSLSLCALFPFSKLCWVDNTSSVTGCVSLGRSSSFSSRMPTTTLFNEPVQEKHATSLQGLSPPTRRVFSCSTWTILPFGRYQSAAWWRNR